jgi:hypothetical protein
MIVFALFTSFTLSFVGLYCLLAAKEMQGYALKHSAKGRFLNPALKDWMSSPRYLAYLRLMGALVFVAGAAATVALAIKWYKSWFI